MIPVLLEVNFLKDCELLVTQVLFGYFGLEDVPSARRRRSTIKQKPDPTIRTLRVSSQEWGGAVVISL